MLAAGAVLLALSGCQLRLAVDVEVDRDGGGRLTVTLGADAELLERAEQAGADPLTDLAAALEDVEGWRVSEHSDDDGAREVSASARFRDPAAFATLTEELARGLSAPEVNLLGPQTLEPNPEQIMWSGTARLVPTEHVTELGLQPEDAVRLAREHDAVRYTVAVTMPGELLSTTADEVDGNRAVWRVQPGEEVGLYALAERPPDRLPAILAGGLLGALVAAIAGWLLLRRLRRPSPPAPAQP